MTGKNSNSLKCRQCGVINWATDQHCRRCQQPLGKPSAQIESGSTGKTFQICLGVFIAALLLPVLVAKADQPTGDNLGMFLVVIAYGLAFSCKFLLIFQMFRVSILWGVSGIIFAPISTLLFTASHWERAKKPIVICFASILYIIVMIAGVGHLTKPNVAQNTTDQPSAPSTKPVDQTPASKTNFLPPPKNEPGKKTSNKK